MICIAVQRNDLPACVAGIADASLLTAIVAGGSAGDDAASFHVAGMCDLTAERTAHVYWIHETPLVSGDRLRFTLVQSDQPTTPIEVKATDSPEYLEEQRQFEEVERTWTPPTEPPPLRWPHLGLHLSLKDDDPIRLRIPVGQEHVMCSLHWNKWRPDHCNVYVRTYTGFAKGTEQRTTDWLRGKLKVGEGFELRLDA